MEELITKVMATFFEGLEEMDAVAFPMMESEYYWWANDRGLIHADAYASKCLVSDLGIYIPHECDFLDYYDGCQRVDLPDGKFYMVEPPDVPHDPVGNDVRKYFKNSVKGMQ